MSDSLLTTVLQGVRERFAGLDDGEPADYIPQLALADRASFGLALASMDGHRYQEGAVGERFTIQSVSKPFVYALVVAELGFEAVSRRVGVEPSGEAFNAISLEPGTGRPANPMINAGAIATTGLLPARSADDRFDRILRGLGRFAGRQLDVDEQVYASESATGSRNRALAYLLSAAGSLAGDPMTVVETYFRQCSVLVDTGDLAVMAATLANGGVNPVSGESVIPRDVAVQVMAVMATCGMYDASGAWMVDVGLPAKSGVSGCLIAVSPGRFGVATYSPPLDSAGNSVRGVAALREMSQRFGLHALQPPMLGAASVTVATTLHDHDHGTGPAAGRITLVAAQGILDFTATERMLHSVRGVVPPAPGRLILDLAAVTRIEPVAAVMIDSMARALAEDAVQVAVVASASVDQRAAGRYEWPMFSDRSAALAWAEQSLGSPGNGI